MFRRKAFLHWYTGEGMDEMEFTEAYAQCGLISGHFVCKCIVFCLAPFRFFVVLLRLTFWHFLFFSYRFSCRRITDFKNKYVIVAIVMIESNMKLAFVKRSD